MERLTQESRLSSHTSPRALVDAHKVARHVYNLARRVGRKTTSRHRRERKQGWEDGRRTKKSGASNLRLRLGLRLNLGYAALLVLLDVAFFTSLAFSFAANSFFTVAAMASVSTL